MTKQPYNKSMWRKIRSWLYKHEFTESWTIEEPRWARQTIPNALCHKCGKGRKLEIRLVSSGKWPVVNDFDIGESHD